MKNLHLKKITLSLVLALSLHATETYTVDDLIIKAMELSPDLKVSSFNYQATKSRYTQAKSEYLPSVDLHISAGRGGMSNIPLNPDDMISDNIIIGSLTLKQLIYDFGQTAGKSDSFKYESDSSLSSHKQLISDKRKNVRRAYYDTLKAIALIGVHKENIKLNEAQLYRSQRYFDAGIRTKIDISDAKVELIKSNLDLKKSLYDLKLAYTTLDKAVGFTETTNDYKVYAQSLDLNNLYNSLTEYDLSLIESVDFAYKNRDELKAYSSNIDSIEAQNRSIDARYYPSIYFNAGYTKQELEEFKNKVPQDQWQLYLNLDWNLYEGGLTDSLAQEKRIQVNIAESNLLYSKLSIKTVTTQAYLNLKKMKDSVELSQSLLKVSQEKFEQASKRYEHGLSDFIELQQARQGYIDTKAALVVDYYSYYSAIAVLDNAIGR